MLKAELLEIIANGENSGIEFNRDDIRPEQLAKELVALANFQGGRILLGVEDDGSISGVQRSNLEQWVMQVVLDKIRPIILPYYEEVKLDDGSSVAVVSILQGSSKPYVLRNLGREDIYIRVGSKSRLATEEQQARLFDLAGILHTETLPVHRTDMGCLDQVRLKNYVKDVLGDPQVPSNPDEWQERLQGLGFLTETVGTVCCTIAGLVLFGKNPRRYLHQAGLRVMVFSGEDREHQAELDERLNRPIVGRWDITQEGKELVDGGLIERFVDAIRPFIAKEAAAIDSGLRREKQWFYPMEAVRECIINALVHRDWTRFIEVEVVRYANRLEVISPGSLPNSMSIEKMKAGRRLPRNNIIVNVLKDYGYVDNRGMGIRAKVIPLTRALNSREPEFEATDDYLKTILYR